MKTKSTFFFLAFALCLKVNSINAQVNKNDSLALVDLFNSANGASWFHHTNWLTKNRVSTWYGVTVINARVSTLDLDSNNLTGSLPSSLGNLSNLRYLDLLFNQLGGGIPSSIGNLINLRNLNLGFNELSGDILSIVNLVNLKNLEIDHNQLSGGIPSSFGNLVKLIRLDAGVNQFSGTIPSSMGKLINLTFFNLGVNQLSGSIPSSFSSLLNLDSLYLPFNQLSGNIPSFIGNLAKLIDLNLRHNQFTGSIPSSMGNLVKLQRLRLEFNRLNETIPSSFGNLVNLQQLNLSSNQLNGTIPSSLVNLHHLNDNGSVLDLRHNHFTFDGMELIAQNFPKAIYAPQQLIPVHKNNNGLSVYAGGTLSNNTYKWFKDNVLVATMKGDSVFHPLQRGNYFVQVKNSIAIKLILRSNTIDYTALPAIASTQSAIQQNDKASGFSIYPNPARDVLHVKVNGTEDISLINQSGKILLTQTINKNGVINVASLSPGLYYLKNNITGDVQKVVISR